VKPEQKRRKGGKTMKRFNDDYRIGEPATSEREGLQGHAQSERFYDRNGHLTGATTNGNGNPRRWTGKTHGEYLQAIGAE
jgi:hypothetical protein